MIPINKPFCGEEELEEVRTVLASGMLTQGPRVAVFEEAVRKVCGSKHAFAMSSATTALHLALVALDVGPGDEVLVSDLSYPATGNVVVQCGATPVFVDVDPGTYSICPKDFAKKLSPRAKAALIVHPFGLMADMVALAEAARGHSIVLVEDAACALGATQETATRMTHAGAVGRMGCFSFHPRKSITTGEGGMITTDDDALADRIRVLRTHGGVREQWYLKFVDAGFNYRLSDINAAVGVAQMRKLDWLLTQKFAHAQQLRTLLQGCPGLTLPLEPPGRHHTYQSFVVVLDDAIDRDAVIGLLRARNVETTLGTYAMHGEPAMTNRYGKNETCPVSARLARQTLTLPLWPQMTPDLLERVATEVRAVLQSPPVRARGAA
jgi:perosamine synthetase